MAATPRDARLTSDSRYTLTRAFTQFVDGNHAAPDQSASDHRPAGQRGSEMRAILEEASLHALGTPGRPADKLGAEDNFGGLYDNGLGVGCRGLSSAVNLGNFLIAKKGEADPTRPRHSSRH
jgi:hypothetical protein